MAVLNISTAVIRDASDFADYVAKKSAVMAAYDVSVVARGEYLKSVAGAEPGAHVAAMFRYPDLATADAFFSSAAYRALLPLREHACDMAIHFYAEAEAAKNSESAN